MKRLWIGLGILIFLLAGSLSISTAMEAIHRPISTQLQLAAEQAEAEDWTAALAHLDQAKSRWEKYHRFTAAFADHTPMDEMDTLLAELDIYAAQQEQPHFSAACVHLSYLATAMAESHQLTWWNLM